MRKSSFDAQRLRHNQALEKRLAEIAMVKERLLKIPEVSEKTVDEVINKIQDIFEFTNYQELKVTLAHFIELTIHYSFDLAAKGSMPVGSDPWGIRTPDLRRDRAAL